MSGGGVLGRGTKPNKKAVAVIGNLAIFLVFSYPQGMLITEENPFVHQASAKSIIDHKQLGNSEVIELLLAQAGLP